MQPSRVGEGAGSGRRFEASSDLWVVAAWWVLVVFLGFARWDYTGDGLRHLPAIVEGAGPRLGEPRWLLFPGLLYVLLRPFVLLGVASDVQALARVMTGATVLAAGAYMLALRACLVAAGFEPRRRAAALAFAGSVAGFVLAATDLMEPIFGATLVVCALGWAAGRVARPGATSADRRRALLVTVAAIAVAALTYQGLVLALGLLPLVFPVQTLRDRRAQALALLILAAIPAVMIGALVLSGDTAGHALARALKGEENVLYSSYMKKSGLASRVVALVAGPPQGLVFEGGFHGFNGLLADLRGGPGHADAMHTLGLFAFSGLIVLGALVAALRRRDGALLAAFGVMMLLPVVRCQQYGYLKYYIFMAVLAAFAAAHARPALVVGLAAALLVLNVGGTALSVPASRRAYEHQVASYARADARSCWVATGWIPPYNFKWPGSVCGVLARLASGHGQTEAEVEQAARGSLSECLDACFCRSSGVYFDDMTEAAAPLLAASAQQFKYTAFDLGELVLPEARAERVSGPGAPPVFRYPPADQRRVCESLTGALAKSR